jgi:hypothetical protein
VNFALDEAMDSSRSNTSEMDSEAVAGVIRITEGIFGCLRGY